MSTFKSNPGKCYSLSADITSVENIPVSLDGSAELLQYLMPDCHTYMQITDGVNCEFVQVKPNTAGTSLILAQRAMDNTTAASFFKGAKVFFVWTDSAMNDFLECRAEAVQDSEAPIKIPGYSATYDEELEQWCYEPDDPSTVTGVSWTVGKTKYTFKDGKITTEAVAGTGLVPGTYNNATVTVGTGCDIIKVEEGDKPLYTPSVCNKCHDENNTP